MFQNSRSLMSMSDTTLGPRRMAIEYSIWCMNHYEVLRSHKLPMALTIVHALQESMNRSHFVMSSGKFALFIQDISH